MRVRDFEKIIKNNLASVGWEGKNLKENLSFFTQGEHEELEVIKFDYSLCDENENCIAVIYDCEFQEDSNTRKIERMIDNLNLQEISFLILINENMELLLIETKTKNKKKVELEEISYKKIKEYIQTNQETKKSYEVEV